MTQVFVYVDNMAGEQEIATPILDQFKADVKAFLSGVHDVSSKKAPAWFKGFESTLVKFTSSIEKVVGELEASHHVQRAVIDGLVSNKNKLEALHRTDQRRIHKLEVDLEDLQQYSRRTNVLIHGIEEEEKEDTDKKAHDLFTEQLGLPLVEKDIARSHRLGKKTEGRNRPIIVRMLSYRQKKAVYDKKSKLKGTKVAIKENLTKERYDFYKECKEKYGPKNVCTLDGRIYRYTDNILPNGKQERRHVPLNSDLD